MQSYIDLLPEGSYMAIGHFWDPGEEDPSLHELARALEERFVRRGLGSGWYRSRDEIASYFGGLPLVEPGLVELDDWWPEGPPPRPRYPEQRLVLGGLAYKRPAWNRMTTGGDVAGPALAGPSGRPAIVSCGGGGGGPWSGGGPAVRGR